MLIVPSGFPRIMPFGLENKVFYFDQFVFFCSVSSSSFSLLCIFSKAFKTISGLLSIYLSISVKICSVGFLKKFPLILLEHEFG